MCLESVFRLISYGSSSLRKNKNLISEHQKPYDNLVIRITEFLAIS